MSRALIVHRISPGATLQDMGRPGWLTEGLSRGGAADQLALAEGTALLGQPGAAALELIGTGGEFEATEDIRIALTGAPMTATLDGGSLSWNASHPMPAGARLSLGGVRSGTYGYLHVGGGFAMPETLGSQSAHLTAGIGTPVTAQSKLPVGPDSGGLTGQLLDVPDRFTGGDIRITESFQSHLFPPETRARFETTPFRRAARGNRMGLRLDSDGDGFALQQGRNVLSETILPGDIQITGDGTPFVLLAECQTTGGYPRIGTVLPCDLPKVAQAAPGAPLRFRFVPLDEAVELERQEAARRAALPGTLRPLIRDPASMHDLLSYQLISGMITGDEE